ncbi:MAG TPA: hypothetical protein VGK57_11365, partial [Candidatus Binatia bacterium]
ISQFTHLPDIGTFARSEKERSLVAMFRLLRGAGSPYFVGPGTSKERVQILQAAFRKAYDDLSLKKNTGRSPAITRHRSIRKTIKPRSEKSRATRKP